MSRIARIDGFRVRSSISPPRAFTLPIHALRGGAWRESAVPDAGSDAASRVAPDVAPDAEVRDGSS